MLKSLEDYNKNTIAKDRRGIALENIKRVAGLRIIQVLALSGSIFIASADSTKAQPVSCKEFNYSSIIPSPFQQPAKLYDLMCTLNIYDISTNPKKIIDVSTIKDEIYMTFSDIDGNITAENQILVDELVAALESEDFSTKVQFWLDTIYKHSGITPTDLDMLLFIKLYIKIEGKNYNEADGIIEGIIINSLKPNSFRRAFDELLLIPEAA